jgi:UDP:flavonoid glycosyltransferase YjiC (YdhE family)
MPWGSAGDVFPFLGLGRQLTERGHDVTLVSNAHFAPAARDLGLRHIELGSEEDYISALNDPDIWHPRKGFRAVVGHPQMPVMVEKQHALIVEAYQRNPEVVVVAGSVAFGARIARETHGIRLVTIHLSPIIFVSVEQPPATPLVTIPSWWPRSWVRALYWFGNQTMIIPVMNRSVGAFRQELGLPRVTRYLHDWIHSPELVLGMFPDWFAHPASDWPRQTELTDFPLFDVAADQSLSREVLDYLKSGSSPVVITFGSAMKVGRKLFAAAAEACQRLGRRGMLLTRFPEQLPDPLPHDMHRFDYVPLTTLLPHVAALVHHGGIGTTAQGLRAGVPQLMTPLGHDQYDNAARVKRLGAGDVLPANQITARRLTRTLDALLQSAQVKTNAEQAAVRLAPCRGLEKTCERLERFASEPRPKPRSLSRPGV